MECCWRGDLGMLLGALLECCSWNAGGVLLESSWNAALAMVLEGCCCRALGGGVLGGRVLGRLLLRGLRFPSDGSELNKVRARV